MTNFGVKLVYWLLEVDLNRNYLKFGFRFYENFKLIGFMGMEVYGIWGFMSVW